MTNKIQGYYPEMGETAPITVATATRSYNGKRIVKSPVELKISRGIRFEGQLKSHQLTAQAQHKVGWYEYTVTDAGMKSVLKQVTVSVEFLLD